MELINDEQVLYSPYDMDMCTYEAGIRQSEWFVGTLLEGLAMFLLVSLSRSIFHNV